MHFFERLLLSIYFYEKKYEHQRFFDAWWQFTHSIDFVAIGILIILLNLICGMLDFRVNPYWYAAPILLIFGMSAIRKE